MGHLAEDLQGPGIERVETHISWVFLREAEVFKVKKPVDLGFLDFTTLEKRLAACQAEVRLNRRVAPHVYRGVVPITQDADGRHRFGGDRAPVDWAVHMARLDDGCRADRLLEQGRLTTEHVEAVAARVAAFHAAARCDALTARFGEVETIAVNVIENFEQTRDTLGRYLRPEQAAEIERWQRDFLASHGELFAHRIAAGRVRDGHGDLRLEHVYLDPEHGVTIVDCIEFNDRFRYADVCADVAFLPMDLAWHGRVDLAETFLAAYAREANDYDLYPLADFYESYRAMVRGKIAAFVGAETEARRYFLLAQACERRPLLEPAVVAVGGIIASGKSTVAAQLARELGAPVVDADRTRKFLLGVAAEQKVHVPVWHGPYSDQSTAATYAELLRRAEAVLASHRPVVLDASFRTPQLRQAARELARRRGVPFFFLECRADAKTCRARLERRARGGGVSDGRLEIFDAFAASWESADELPAGEHVVLETTRPLTENLERLRALIATWPAGLHA